MHKITILDKDTYCPCGPFLVQEIPTQDEIERLKDNIGPNVEITVREVEYPKRLDDILQKKDWVMTSSSATVKGDMSFYVESTTDDPSQNTWTKDVKGATTFNCVAAIQKQAAFANYGRRNYCARQLP